MAAGSASLTDMANKVALQWSVDWMQDGYSLRGTQLAEAKKNLLCLRTVFIRVL